MIRHMKGEFHHDLKPPDKQIQMPSLHFICGNCYVWLGFISTRWHITTSCMCPWVHELCESQRLFDYRQLQTSSLDTLVRRFHFNVSSLNSRGPLHTPNFQTTPQESHHVPQRWFIRVRRPKPSLTLERESKTDYMGRDNQDCKSRTKKSNKPAALTPYPLHELWAAAAFHPRRAYMTSLFHHCI